MNTRKPFRIYCLTCYFLVLSTLPFASQSQTRDEKAVRLILQRQSDAWNKGNITEFMNGYWKNDSLLFIGKSGPKWGYATTLENYKKGYPDTAAMGKLHFDLLHMKRLSPVYYFVAGKWTLQRSIGDLHGYFTLLFRKIKNTWVIISDHSS